MLLCCVFFFSIFLFNFYFPTEHLQIDIENLSFASTSVEGIYVDDPSEISRSFI
ncbi:hypothetical protein RND81_01G215900 [Saponaria officinalis]|uniref:Uncharacterized protein n=1 Tax=Saponaria officinalis TaxID=3572 RepID=A0AAW1NGC8_SAPOF